MIRLKFDLMLWWFFFKGKIPADEKEKMMIWIMFVSPHADTKERGESSCDIWWWRSRRVFKGNKDTPVSIILIDKLIFSLKTSPGRLGTFFLKIFQKREKSRVLDRNRRKKWRYKSEQLLTTHTRTPAFFWMDSDRIVCLIGPVDGLWAVRICAGRCAPDKIGNLSPFPLFSNRLIFFNEFRRALSGGWTKIDQFNLN